MKTDALKAELTAIKARLEAILEQLESVPEATPEPTPDGKVMVSLSDDGGVSSQWLADRLGVSLPTLAVNRTKPTFPQWSESKDPDGFTWINVVEPGRKRGILKRRR